MATPLSGITWGHSPITWAFAPPGAVSTLGTVTTQITAPAEIAAVMAGIYEWTKVSGVQLQQLPTSSASSADIRIGYGFPTDSNGAALLGQAQWSYNTANNHYNFALILLSDPTNAPLGVLNNPFSAAFSQAFGPDGAGGSLGYVSSNVSLQQLACHEFGAELGLAEGDGTDLTSVMDHVLTSSNRLPDSADITAIQSLYGAPTTAVSWLSLAQDGDSVSGHGSVDIGATANLSQQNTLSARGAVDVSGGLTVTQGANLLATGAGPVVVGTLSTSQGPQIFHVTGVVTAAGTAPAASVAAPDGTSVAVESSQIQGPVTLSGKGLVQDAAHLFGSDLSVDATGDLATSFGTQLGQERVLRRLLSNPGGYVWWLDYGAGLSRFIGRPASPRRIAAITRSQMFREAAVARNPLPTITVAVSPDGTFTEAIRYVDAQTGSTVVLSVPVSD